MCVNRAMRGSRGTREFVRIKRSPAGRVRGGGRGARLKHCPSCGCQPPGLPDSGFGVCVVTDCAVSFLALGCFREEAGLLKKIQLMCPRAKQACLSLTLTCFTDLLGFDSK